MNIKKHILKKFVFEVQFTEEEMEKIKKETSSFPFEELPKIKKENFKLPTFVITDTNKILNCFPYKAAGRISLIPEPDPVLIFFNSAYLNYATIAETKKTILAKLLEPTLNEVIINDLYNYFGMTCGFVTFLFTALEAFMNQFIPDDYQHSKKGNKCIETYNKEEIQRHFTFKEKLLVMAKISGKDFSETNEPTFQVISNLKDYRDSIVHLKQVKEGSSAYNYIYKKALDYKYSDALNSVAKFLNYYKPDYIEECPCKHNW